MRETILNLPHLPGGEVRLAGWLTRPGQVVRRGQPLCCVEQDGRHLDIPALRAGVVRRRLATVSDALPPGAQLVALETADVAWSGDIAVADGLLHVRRWPARGTPRGTFLLLHGFAGSLDTWTRTAAGLGAEGFVAVAPDLPGHGATVLDAPTPEAIARTLALAWDDLALRGPVHLVGHSMGGAVALLLAADRAGRRAPGIASVTLIAPLGLGSPLDADFLGGVLAARDACALQAALRPLTLSPAPPSHAALTEMLAMLNHHRPALSRLAAALAEGARQSLDLRATLAALAVPARIVIGDHDAVLSWADLVPPPHVPLHRLPCGHMPHWEQPAVMRRILAQSDWRAHPSRSGEFK